MTLLISGWPASDPVLDLFFRWTVGSALPLWVDRGFDVSASMFEEQLAFDGSRDPIVSRRVMVQARQISVFALATQAGWFDGRSVVAAAGEAMIERYWAADGAPGWVFSLTRDGTVARRVRDLYAHAFVLFALAWLHRVAPGPHIDRAIDRTLDMIDRHFADPIHGGHWDALPRPDALKRQNPHMHLLEACLELYAATGEPAHLDRAGDLVALALRSFIDPRSGALREFYHDDWTVAPSAGAGVVEPGHQFEWAWLLRRFEAMSGRDLGDVIAVLCRSALTHGTDRRTGRVIDEVGEDGRVRATSSRCWPHTEALKCLAVETARGTADFRPEIAAITSRLLAAYCPPSLNGGWIDRLSDADAPASTAMPASTLYHLAFALAELERCFPCSIRSGSDDAAQGIQCRAESRRGDRPSPLCVALGARPI